MRRFQALAHLAGLRQRQRRAARADADFHGLQVRCSSDATRYPISPAASYAPDAAAGATSPAQLHGNGTRRRARARRSCSASRRAATRPRPPWWRAAPTAAAASSPTWCARSGSSIAATAAWCRRSPRARMSNAWTRSSRQAMREAGADLSRLDAVAVTAGPGLIGGLLVGVATAKAIALVHDLPLVAVNHLEAHALTVGLTEGLLPPYLLLLVSGGHTQTARRARRRPLSERSAPPSTTRWAKPSTRQRSCWVSAFPAGPRWSRPRRGAEPERFALPRPMLGRPEPHFSFAGLKTAVRHQAQALVPLRGAGCRRPVRRVRGGGRRQRRRPRAPRHGDCRRELARARGRHSSSPAASPPTGACALHSRPSPPARVIRCTCRRRRCARTTPPWWPGPAPSGWRAAG